MTGLNIEFKCSSFYFVLYYKFIGKKIASIKLNKKKNRNDDKTNYKTIKLEKKNCECKNLSKVSQVMHLKKNK